MSDDRLRAALKRLGTEDLSTASDRAIRGRLETAWTARARIVAAPRFGIRRFAPVLAALVFVVGFSGSALGATADSPLWDTRLALEAAGALLRPSNDDRIAYLLDLVQSRTEEAARQEAAGHPGAAAKARTAASLAVVELDGNIPRLDTTLPNPVPSALPTPSPASSPSRSESPAPSTLPAVQPSTAVSPTPARTETPRAVPTSTPVHVETLRPATPVPTRTATPTTSASAKPTVTITGAVRDAAGANISDACISTSPQFPTSTTQCIYKTKSGSYGFSATVAPGQSITLYAYWISPSGENFAGSTTGTVTAPTTVMPAVTLTLRK
jgi:hypothetical protein